MTKTVPDKVVKISALHIPEVTIAINFSNNSILKNIEEIKFVL